MPWTIEQILSDADAAVTFGAYAADNGFADEVNFLRAVKDYHVRPTEVAARAIYRTYIEAGADRHVALPADIRQPIADNIAMERPAGEAMPEDLFNAAGITVEDRMDPRIEQFVRTAEGERYAGEPGNDAHDGVEPDAENYMGDLGDIDAALAEAAAAEAAGGGIDGPPEAPEEPDLGPDGDQGHGGPNGEDGGRDDRDRGHDRRGEHPEERGRR